MPLTQSTGIPVNFDNKVTEVIIDHLLDADTTLVSGDLEIHGSLSVTGSTNMSMNATAGDITETVTRKWLTTTPQTVMGHKTFTGGITTNGINGVTADDVGETAARLWLTPNDQTISGRKTFTGNITANGISGVTADDVGETAARLWLTPNDQTIPGHKTFTGNITVNGDTNVTVGADQVVDSASKRMLTTSAQTITGPKTFEDGVCIGPTHPFDGGSTALNIFTTANSDPSVADFSRINMLLYDSDTHINGTPNNSSIGGIFAYGYDTNYRLGAKILFSPTEAWSDVGVYQNKASTEIGLYTQSSDDTDNLEVPVVSVRSDVVSINNDLHITGSLVCDGVISGGSDRSIEIGLWKMLRLKGSSLDSTIKTVYDGLRVTSGGDFTIDTGVGATSVSIKRAGTLALHVDGNSEVHVKTTLSVDQDMVVHTGAISSFGTGLYCTNSHVVLTGATAVTRMNHFCRTVVVYANGWADGIATISLTGVNFRTKAFISLTQPAYISGSLPHTFAVHSMLGVFQIHAINDQGGVNANFNKEVKFNIVFFDSVEADLVAGSP